MIREAPTLGCSDRYKNLVVPEIFGQNLFLSLFSKRKLIYQNIDK
jgi:hypothetical protein